MGIIKTFFGKREHSEVSSKEREEAKPKDIQKESSSKEPLEMDGTQRKLKLLSEDLSALFTDHLRRIRGLMSFQTQTMRTVLDQIETQWAENLPIFSLKVFTTLSDGQLHSCAVGGGGSVVYLNVYVLPVPRKDARAYFARGTPPTYTEVLGRMSQTAPVQMARETGTKVLSHVVICADPKGGPLAIQMSVIPFRGAGKDYAVLVADELLSEEERRLWSQT